MLVQNLTHQLDALLRGYARKAQDPTVGHAAHKHEVGKVRVERHEDPLFARSLLE